MEVRSQILTEQVNHSNTIIDSQSDVTKINDAVVEEADIFIYNLGTVFVIDRVLFASQERISQVLAKNADRIPSFGLDGVASGPAVDESQTLVVDLLDELTTTQSTAGKLVIRE